MAAGWIIAYLRHPKSQYIFFFRSYEINFTIFMFQHERKTCLENNVKSIRPKTEYENQIYVTELMIRFVLSTNIENDE